MRKSRGHRLQRLIKATSDQSSTRSRGIMFVFKDFTKHVKFAHRLDVEIDNIVFRLHYRLTFWFLMACCFIVSSKQFIKDHINCIADKSVSPVVDTFCFFSSTFTVVKYHNSSYLNGHLVAHPGVGPYSGEEDIVRHSYYQWVPFVLFLQGLMFYGPRKLWKHTDGGRLAAFVHRVRTSRITDDEDREINNVKIESLKSRSNKVEWFSKAYITMSRFRVSRDWARMLVVCEFLNALNLVFQMWLTNKFLQGQFLNLGLRWYDDDFDAIDLVFPKVTKCTFHKYGPTGTIQNHDTMCIMSLNILNEKIYVLLWFWFIGLFLVTSLSLVWRLLTYFLHRSFAFNRFVWGEISPGPAIYSQDIETLSRSLHFSDWLFLYYIGKNINGKMFRTAVSEIAKDINALRPKSKPLLQLDNSVEDDPKESDC
ncbi:hypothetical protein GE061_020074 [Apolygus lucorum]|uniref:Innexin n=1 Tax=Apolygus lucorum TaxID=248454 RepID=A0A8S9XBF9_APOLU|nr:hypothetical protein GE061_020074 [Apolygus lucorum]